MSSPPQMPPSGWYPDPAGSGDERYWDAPAEFRPERFAREAERPAAFTYVPFGGGPRVCIGATFAMQEAIIALGVLMHRFRFDMTAETKAWPVQRLTTQPANGLALRVTARRRASSIS